MPIDLARLSTEHLCGRIVCVRAQASDAALGVGFQARQACIPPPRRATQAARARARTGASCSYPAAAASRSPRAPPRPLPAGSRAPADPRANGAEIKREFRG
eukprot:5567878-Pleurochrysis_carterae.AAC.2